MKNRSLPVIIVSILLILAGAGGFVRHITELAGSHNTLKESIWGLLLGILAVVCGVLLLLKINWARCLAIAWLVCHVIISAFHSTSEMIAHIVLLILISVLLFLPASNAYFQSKNKK